MSVLDALDDITLQALATAVALALSVFTFARQEYGKRAADLTVSCEHIPAERLPKDYVVVHNSGPAVARGVEVKFLQLRDDVHPIEGGETFASAIDIPAGHSARLRYSAGLAEHSETMQVTWRDRRRGTHTLVAPTNVVILPGTPVVNVEVVTTDPPRSGVARRGIDRY